MPGHPISEPERDFHWPPDDDDLTRAATWPSPEPPPMPRPTADRVEDLLWADPDYVHPLAHELPLVVVEAPVAGAPPAPLRPQPVAPPTAARGMRTGLPAALLAVPLLALAGFALVQHERKEALPSHAPVVMTEAAMPANLPDALPSPPDPLPIMPANLTVPAPPDAPPVPPRPLMAGGRVVAPSVPDTPAMPAFPLASLPAFPLAALPASPPPGPVPPAPVATPVVPAVLASAPRDPPAARMAAHAPPPPDARAPLVRVAAAQPKPFAPACRAILQRAMLGDRPTARERAQLREGCHASR